MRLCDSCFNKIKISGPRFCELCEECKQKHEDEIYLLNRRIKLIERAEFEVFKLRPLKTTVEFELNF
jgi:hypothetical protein